MGLEARPSAAACMGCRSAVSASNCCLRVSKLCWLLSLSSSARASCCLRERNHPVRSTLPSRSSFTSVFQSMGREHRQLRSAKCYHSVSPSVVLHTHTHTHTRREHVTASQRNAPEHRHLRCQRVRVARRRRRRLTRGCRRCALRRQLRRRVLQRRRQRRVLLLRTHVASDPISPRVAYIVYGTPLYAYAGCVTLRRSSPVCTFTWRQGRDSPHVPATASPWPPV